MSNSDLLYQADKILRPVLRKLSNLPWMKVTACCAGHEPADSVWIETHVRGSSGLSRLMELLRVFERKLVGTDCRVDCLVNYGTDAKAVRIQHGWFPIVVEVFWPPKDDWRRGQALIVEALLSSVEEFGERVDDDTQPQGAIVYCPYCSSSFIRLEALEPFGHRYLCRDCETPWTMSDPPL